MALLAAAVPLLLPPEDGIPWWSWIFGALGIAALVQGALVWGKDGELHDVSGATLQRRTVPFGPLLALHAAPLLTVPLTYVVRSLTGSDTATATSSVGRGHAELRLHWEL